MKFNTVAVSRRPPWPIWAVWIVLAWAGLGAGALWLSQYYGSRVELCLIKHLTGIPCPTCGFTRGTLMFLRGNIIQSWLYNPLLFSAIGIYCILAAVRIVFARGIRVHLTRQERRIVWAAAVFLFICNWAYVIVVEFGA